MESSDYTRLDYKTINEFFPKGQLSILAAGPGVGKTVFATQIANQFCRHGENTLYFCLEYDSRVIINHLDPVGNGNVRCCITDIPRISLEDILLAIKKRYFNVIIILIRIRIDGSENALPDDCLSYLDREFLKKRIKVLHRESYYSDDSGKEDLESVSIIEYVSDSSYSTILKYI